MLKNLRVWAEINLDNIAHNMQKIKKYVNYNTDIMAIVKADAYGHGAIEVSKILLYNGAKSLGVATFDEGILLRENNIFVPILILGYTPNGMFDFVVNNNLIQTIFKKDMAINLSEISKKYNKVCEVHIKIDTGMGRIGFKPIDNSIEEIIEISKLNNIHISGIYTHLANSDSSDQSFTNEQFRTFRSFIDKLKIKGLKNFKTHISNSGAIINNSSLSMDIVRPGIILYGLSPSSHTNIEKLDLLPVMSLKSRISFLKDIEKNVSIGYGRKFYSKDKMRVATIPIGYADGYMRDLSNKSHVIVGNSYAKVIGNICMDQLMVDVSDIENIKEEDEVILIGKKNNLEIRVDEIAKIGETINYEVVCHIGKRVPRVYIKNNEMLKMINL